MGLTSLIHALPHACPMKPGWVGAISALLELQCISSFTGDMTLKVPESVHSQVLLEASDISLDDRVNDLDLDCVEDGQKTTVVGKYRMKSKL